MQIVGDGVLEIRKVFYVTQTYKNGSPGNNPILSFFLYIYLLLLLLFFYIVNQASPYIEAWSPFLVPLFSCLALHIQSDGTPDWYYETGYNIPYYPCMYSEGSGIFNINAL